MIIVIETAKNYIGSQTGSITLTEPTVSIVGRFGSRLNLSLCPGTPIIITRYTNTYKLLWVCGGE